MAEGISTTPQSPFPVRKRRSWFERGDRPGNINLATENIVQDGDVEVLVLSHFTKPPRLDFGTVRTGKTKCCKLIVRNPEEYEQEVVVERFPTKKNFELDQVSRF